MAASMTVSTLLFLATVVPAWTTCGLQSLRGVSGLALAAQGPSSSRGVLLLCGPSMALPGIALHHCCPLLLTVYNIRVFSLLPLPLKSTSLTLG